MNKFSEDFIRLLTSTLLHHFLLGWIFQFCSLDSENTVQDVNILLTNETNKRNYFIRTLYPSVLECCILGYFENFSSWSSDRNSPVSKQDRYKCEIYKFIVRQLDLSIIFQLLNGLS